ncbi:VOC family protein [Synechococcus sp. PCC 7335]|uniref:VOC family protein n=1 Tax=Synechococcus sp. (strain ATCC 29403 / PCC 7335) TaxID=91464 RepID=UPI0002EFBF8D|nr:VOC family protein [Synechococcus sp. PCC 7335]
MSISDHSQSAFVTSAFVTLASVNLEALIEFYVDFLAIAPCPSTSSYAEFQLPGLRLAIFKPQAASSSEFAASSSGAASICLEVADLAAAIARLNAIGHAPSGDIIHASHGKEVYVYDPDGNRLILHQGDASR